MKLARILALLLVVAVLCGTSWLVDVRVQNDTDGPIAVTLTRRIGERTFDEVVSLPPGNSARMFAGKNRGSQSLRVTAVAGEWSVSREFQFEEYPPALKRTSSWGTTPICHVHISESGVQLHGPNLIDRVWSSLHFALLLLITSSPVWVLVAAFLYFRGRRRAEA